MTGSRSPGEGHDGIYSAGEGHDGTTVMPLKGMTRKLCLRERAVKGDNINGFPGPRQASRELDPGHAAAWKRMLFDHHLFYISKH